MPALSSAVKPPWPTKITWLIARPLGTEPLGCVRTFVGSIGSGREKLPVAAVTNPQLH